MAKKKKKVRNSRTVQQTNVFRRANVSLRTQKVQQADMPQKEEKTSHTSKPPEAEDRVLKVGMQVCNALCLCM